MAIDIEKSALSLGGKGVQSASARFHLFIHHVYVSLGWGVAVALLPILLFLFLSTPTSLSLSANSIRAAGSVESEKNQWIIKCRYDDFSKSTYKCGDQLKPDEFAESVISVSDGQSIRTELTSSEYLKVVKANIIPIYYGRFEPSFDFWMHLVGWLSVILFISVTVSAFFKFVKHGRKETSNQRIDGVMDLVDQKQLSHQLKRDYNGGAWRVGEICLPDKALIQALGINGVQRSGKSILMHDLICQAIEKKVMLFVHDPHFEFMRAHFKEGDVVIWPPSEISPGWSITNEIKYQFDSVQLAAAFIPDKGEPFFAPAARTVFDVLLQKMCIYGVKDTRDLARAFFSSSPEEMDQMVAKTPAAEAVSSTAKGQRVGVIATASIHMMGLLDVKPGDWSLREHIDKNAGNIYFCGSEARYAALKRLMMMTALEAIAQRKEIQRDTKYLFVLDEYPVLGEIDLERQLAEKAKWGISFVIGTQTKSQMETALGKLKAETVNNLMGTFVQLRLNAPEDMQAAEKRFGEQLVRVVGESQTMALAEGRDSFGVNKSEKQKPLIMGAKFAMLSPLTGYFKPNVAAPSAFIDFRGWGKPGTASDGIRTKLDELNTPIHPMPEIDDRFLQARGGSGDWRYEVRVELLNAQIERADYELNLLSKDSDIKDKQAEIKKKREELRSLQGDKSLKNLPSLKNTIAMELDMSVMDDDLPNDF